MVSCHSYVLDNGMYWVMGCDKELMSYDKEVINESNDVRCHVYSLGVSVTYTAK
jgi:hypothetical protein